MQDRFRVGRSSNSTPSRPPPFIIKFVNERYWMAVLRPKKSSLLLPSDEEKKLGIKKHLAVEDLTGPTD